MRKSLVSLLVVASLAASSTAMAATDTATGPIKGMDAKACTVTLENNSVYQFAAKCDFSKLKAGEKVVITFEKKGAVNEASKIEAAK